MSLSRTSLKERGASVLAAIILVVILGAILLLFQYVRSSGDFAYESQSLAASVGTAASAPSAQTAPQSSKTGTCDFNTASCPCTSDKTTSSSGSIDQQCLPGCQYDATVQGTSVAVISVGEPSSADPKTWPNGTPPPGYVQFCGADGQSCSARMECKAGQGLSSSDLQTLQIQSTVAAITNASSPADVQNQVNLFTAQGGNTQDLSNEINQAVFDLKNDPNADTNDAALNASSVNNLTAADNQLAALANPTPTTAGSSASVDLNNGTYGSILTSGPAQSQSTGLYGENQLTSQNDPAVAQANADAANAAAVAKNCAGSACVDLNTNNYNGPADTFQGPCPTGETQVSTGCVVMPNGTTPTPAATNNNNGIFGSNGLGSNLTSFLTGLVQGISRGLASQSAAQAAQAAQTAAAPYGVGTNGVACSAPPTQPDPSQCTVGGWQAVSSSNNGCLTGWNCIPITTVATTATTTTAATTTTTATTTVATTTVAVVPQPTATLSCEPQVADVGMTVSMSYACGSSTDSSGSGFVTGDQLSGSTTTVMTAPPAGTNTVSYGITCINQSLTAGAQCSVQINQPSIVLVANPSMVASGASAAIGWVTSGMSACTISSPDSAAFTAANATSTTVDGVATTPPLQSAMNVVLNCTTIAGGTRTATAKVTVGGAATSTATTSPVTVSSSVDGGSLAHGSAVTITWSTTGAPSGSAMSLWLLNKQTGKVNDVITSAQPLSGSYTWNVPAVGAACNQNAANVCATDLVDGDSYAIEAVLYTPSNAYIGDGTPPSNPVAPTYGASSLAGSFTVSDATTGSE